MFADLPADSPLRARALQMRNLTIVAPAEGVIGGNSYSWQAVDDVPRNPNLFVRDAVTATNPKPVSGKVALGNFNVLCEFLNSF
jgi:hypothetical protein